MSNIFSLKMSPLLTYIDVSGQWNTKHVGQSLRALYVAPGLGKVPGPHFLVDVHLEAVAVAAYEDAVDPDKCHVAVITLDSFS